MSIIGISGKIGSGKDTVCDMMQYLIMKDIHEDSHISDILDEGFQPDLQYGDGINWEIHRFADEIKDTVCKWIGCTREQLEDREFKEKPLGKEWWVVKTYFPANKYKEKVFRLHAYTEWDSRILDGSDAVSEIIKTTPRKLMQLLGTDCGRQIIHPDIWVNALFADYKPPMNKVGKAVMEGYTGKKINYQESKWIVPDVRFPNEISRIAKHGGLKIRVERDFRKRMPELFIEYGYDSSDNAEAKRMFYSYLRREHPDQYEKITHPSETSLDSYKDWDYIIHNNYSMEVLIQAVTNILKEEEII